MSHSFAAPSSTPNPGAVRIVSIHEYNPKLVATPVHEAGRHGTLYHHDPAKMESPFHSTNSPLTLHGSAGRSPYYVPVAEPASVEALLYPALANANLSAQSASGAVASSRGADATPPSARSHTPSRWGDTGAGVGSSVLRQQTSMTFASPSVGEASPARLLQLSGSHEAQNQNVSEVAHRSAATVEQLRTRCLMLSSCLEHTTTERDALSAMITSLCTVRDKLLRDVEELRDANHQLQRTNESSEKEHVVLVENLRLAQMDVESGNAAKVELQKVQEDLRSLRSTLRNVEDERESLAQTVALLEVHRSQRDGKITEMELTLELSQNRVSSLEAALAEARVIEGQVERMMLEREDELHVTQQELSAARRENEELRASLQRSNQAVEREVDVITTLTASQESLVAQTKQLQANLDQLYHDKKVLLAQLKEHHERHESLLRNRDALEFQHGAVQGGSEQLQQRLQELREEHQHLIQKYEEALDAKTALLATEADLRARLVFADAAVAEKTVTAQHITARCEVLDATVQSLRSAVDAADAEGMALRNKLESACAANEALTSELAALQAALDGKTAAFEEEQISRKADVAELRIKILSVESQLKEMELQCTQRQEALDILTTIQPQLAQVAQFNSEQRKFALTHLKVLEQENASLAQRVEEANGARRAAEDITRVERDEKTDLQRRLEALERTFEQTSELLQLTRQDRDLLANEIRRSQTLWMTMSEEQAQLRSCMLPSHNSVATPNSAAASLLATASGSSPGASTSTISGVIGQRGVVDVKQRETRGQSNEGTEVTITGVTLHN